MFLCSGGKARESAGARANCALTTNENQSVRGRGGDRLMWIKGVGIRGVLISVASCMVLAGSSGLAHGEPTSPGVWCERTNSFAVSREHQERLVLSLRRITGFCHLAFDTEGSLNVCDTSAVVSGAAG